MKHSLQICLVNFQMNQVYSKSDSTLDRATLQHAVAHVKKLVCPNTVRFLLKKKLFPLLLIMCDQQGPARRRCHKYQDMDTSVSHVPLLH